jgi:L-ascorbate metabolism protein UlaG (beta-lactamase superfamily)
MAVLTGLRRERALGSPQFADGLFRNPSGLGPGLKDGQAWGVMREFLFGGKSRVPPGPIVVENPRELWGRSDIASGLRVTWLGHSTLLLESDGVRVLTDPVFGERASPFSFAGPKRFHPVPARISELPRLDAVLLSHDHHDHLCPESIRELGAQGVPIVTSLGVGAHLEALGVRPEHIVELDWWESYQLPRAELRFHACPAQHFSGRGLLDRNTTLWSSWVIETARRKLFFSGDTGLTEDFRTIADRLGPFDLTLLEIGAYHPAWGDIHLGPHNALTAFEWLGGGTLLPVHWGTFDLGLHPWHEPAETLLTLAAEKKARILTPRLGRPFEPAQVEHVDPWWREVLPQPLAKVPLPEAPSLG